MWHQDGYRFWSCRECGSESSDRRYTPADYDCDNRDDYFLQALGSWDRVLLELTTNIDLFVLHGGSVAGKRFLDVGYCDGAMMQKMCEGGCECHGFDVFNHKAEKIAARAGVPVENLKHGADVTECYAGEKFDLVNCREVIEHVPDPLLLMRQMSDLLADGGLLQVQTPQPSSSDSRIPYQIQHLCLISPHMLRAAGMACGLVVRQQLMWPDGQAVVFQKAWH